jgi:hypothetical protein
MENINFVPPEVESMLVVSENYARQCLQAFLERGVKIGADPEQLTHADLIYLVREIFERSARNEAN